MPLASADLAAATARPAIWITKGTTISTTAGRLTTSWAASGNPPAGSYDTTLNGAVCTGSTTGALQRTDPASGNSYLYKWVMNQGTTAITQDGVIWLCDRLWHNGGYDITSTGSQSITSPTWPSRCPTSVTDDTPTTTGLGVLLAVEVSATTGSGTPTITVGYTNQSGTSGRTATNIATVVTASATHTTYLLDLQAGDTGVRSVQSLTLSATWTSGTMNLIAYRPIALMKFRNDDNQQQGWITGGSGRIYDSSCLYFMLYATTASASPGFCGYMQETQG